MENKETVCAVVVTYNRKDLLIECLDALLKQTRPIDAMYIIDNLSNDGTERLLFEKGFIEKLPPESLNEPWEKKFEVKNLVDGNSVIVYYVRMNENTGGAGGFHEGVKRGYERGYDWLWLMDDDVEPDKNCLLELSAYFKQAQALVPLRLSKKYDIREMPAIKYNLSNPFKIDNRDVSIYSRYKSIEEMPTTLDVEDFSFEGPIVQRKIVEKIGFPKKDLFIYGDDTDYALKIRYLLNEHLLLITSARMFRKLETSSSLELTWKSYFATRNVFYINFKYGENFFVKTKPYLIFIAMLLKNIILLKFNNLSKKAKIFFFALVDAKKNPMPRRFQPGDIL